MTTLPSSRAERSEVEGPFFDAGRKERPLDFGASLRDAPSLGVTEKGTDPPYTTALMLKLSAAMGELDGVYDGNGHDTPAGLARAANAADILLAHGIALVEPDRARAWIDERVYSGALFRLRLAEAPPSITLPQDLFI